MSVVTTYSHMQHDNLGRGLGGGGEVEPRGDVTSTGVCLDGLLQLQAYNTDKATSAFGSSLADFAVATFDFIH